MSAVPKLGFGAAIGLAAATPSLADNSRSEALGGPILECSGTIVWAAEDEGGATRDVPMQFAVVDNAGANEIALYTDQESFLPDDVWPCSDEYCTALRTMPSGVTTNVLRLSKAPDAGDGKAAYTLSAIFSVISARDDGLTSAAASGKGPFSCEKPLPNGVVAPG
jgi:hypothetical protein